MTSHYTRGSMTTLHDFEGVLGRPWDTFLWALTISWSRHFYSWLVCGVALTLERFEFQTCHETEIG